MVTLTDSALTVLTGVYSPLKDCKQCLLLWLSDNYYFMSFSVAGHNVVTLYLVCLHSFKYLLEQSSVFCKCKYSDTKLCVSHENKKLSLLVCYKICTLGIHT